VDHQPPRPQNPGKDCLLILRAAAHAETSGLKYDGRGVQTRLRASRFQTTVHGALQLGPALVGCGVVARPGFPHPQYAAGFVTDHRRSARLPAIHSQKKSWRMQSYSANPASAMTNPNFCPSSLETQTGSGSMATRFSPVLLRNSGATAWEYCSWPGISKRARSRN